MEVNKQILGSCEYFGASVGLWKSGWDLAHGLRQRIYGAV